jgi:hypothetical protein
MEELMVAIMVLSVGSIFFTSVQYIEKTLETRSIIIPFHIYQIVIFLLVQISAAILNFFLVCNFILLQNIKLYGFYFYNISLRNNFILIVITFFISFGLFILNIIFNLIGGILSKPLLRRTMPPIPKSYT